MVKTSTLLNYSFDFKLIIPELFLIFVISVLLLFALLTNNRLSLMNSSFLKGYLNSFKTFSFINPIFFLSILSLFFYLLLSINQLYFNTPLIPIFNSLFIYGYSVIVSKILLTLFSFPILYQTKRYLLDKNLHLYEVFILYFILLLSGVLIISSNDFLSFYLSFELQSLILYIFISLKRDSIYSVEAGIKYFILSAISSAFLLYGIALFYGYLGLTNFNAISKAFSYPFEDTLELTLLLPVFVALLLVLFSIFFKLSIAPFHIWTPDVYQGAPLFTTIILSTFSKFVFSLFLLKFFTTYNIVKPIIWYIPWFNQLLHGVSFFSIIIGSIGALAQTSLKRIFAYSTITHIGFIILTLSQGSYSSQVVFLAYLFIYIFLSLNFFTIILSVKEQVSFKPLRFLNQLPTLFTFNPILAFCLLLNLFSLAGIPPVIGFWIKYLVFQELILNSSTFFYFFVLVFIILTSISTFYYIRLIKIIFFDNPINFNFYYPLSRTTSLIISFNLLINLFLLLKFDLVLNFSKLLIFEFTNFF